MVAERWDWFQEINIDLDHDPNPSAGLWVVKRGGKKEEGVLVSTTTFILTLIRFEKKKLI